MRIELKKRLGDLLVENKVITSEQLNKALEAQQAHGRRLGQTLVNLEFISEIQLAKFLAQQLDLPFINLNQKYIDIETVLRLPEVQARRYRALVTEYNPNTVLVALSDPSDIQAQDHIEHFFHPQRTGLFIPMFNTASCISYFVRSHCCIANKYYFIVR